ncbi:rhodanese-like domain-containing protein [Sulfuricurvum sp.]|uniref:rhodanese-like domain-containing protein n=1 Tax=Sulfuricurvum sp. TaxID=2025608 RepID=UPI00262F3BAC|nr:rhodanese-like domain-containing protein [Sulfuricurvum sp.]MDD2267135.1 rhodanese-like domain-containing protein [Sulfuricurvum sp.]MDD2785208.1 rhodanese-like domain-containing protein [Sulfuricurvum sp.]
MFKMSSLILTLLIVSVSSWADAPSLSEETKVMLKEAKAHVDPIEPQKLKELMADEKIILLDVRDPDEWEKSTIQYDRQVKISRGFLEIKYPKLILDKYSKDDTFVVYCALEPRSVFAAQRLQQLGFKHVMYLQGGLKNFNP